MKITPIKQAVNKNFEFLKTCIPGRIQQNAIEQVRKSAIRDIQFEFKKERLRRQHGTN